MINIISACTDWQNNGISAVSYGNNVKAGETEMEQVAKLLNGKGQHRYPDRPVRRCRRSAAHGRL